MRVISVDDKEGVEAIIKRSGLNLDSVMNAVRPIIKGIIDHGDSSLFKYTKKFDSYDISPGNLRVSEKEIKEAYSNVDKGLINALMHARAMSSPKG